MAHPTLTPLRSAELLETAVDPYGADAAGEDAQRRASAASTFLARTLLEPRIAELEARGEFPEAELRAFAVDGHLHPFVPHAHGGSFDWPTAMRIALRLASHDLDTALCFGGTILATTPLLVAATEAQRDPPFRAILRGEMIAFALTEWVHGSDLAANEATASGLDASSQPALAKAAHAFRLDGTKAPANNGSRGAFVVALLRTSDEQGPFAHSLFLMERGLAGMAPHPQFRSIGYRSMDLSGVVFDRAIVSRDAVLGIVGEGFPNARRALEISRSGVAMLGAGVAVTAVARAVSHAQTRMLYGSPIAELGGVQSLVGRVIARALESVAVCRRTAWAVARAARIARHWTSLAARMGIRGASLYATSKAALEGSRAASPSTTRSAGSPPT